MMIHLRNLIVSAMARADLGLIWGWHPRCLTHADHEPGGASR